MKKKILALLLAAATAVSMAGCGGAASSDTSSDANASTDTTTDASADSSSEEETLDWSKYDALIDQIRTDTDFADRVDLMHKAEDMLMSTWAVIPIYYYNDIYMMKPTVSGMYDTVYGIKYFQGAQKEGDTNININLASEPQYVDPALNSYVDGACLVSNMFSGLYKYDENSQVVPEIAEDMPEVSDDGTVYTVKLKQTTWSDGTPVTAKDFIYSWNRVIDEKTAADYAYLFDIVAKNDDGTLKVEAPDDYTLQVTLTNPCPYFNALMAFPVFYPVPQSSVEAADPDGTTPSKWCQEAGFITNGAYTMTAWTHNESMTFTKNPAYFDAANVKSDTLTFMLSEDSTATYAAYQSGALDMVDDVPTDEIPNVKDSPEFHKEDQLGTYYLAFNVNSDLFKDMSWSDSCKFRHAISDLIDRQYIIDTVAQTGQVAADSYIPAGMSDGNGGEFKNKSYYDATTPNVEEAKSLLEECGYTFTDNGDGTYTPDKDITLPYITNDAGGHVKIAECIQSDLSVLGINMDISKEDWNVFLQDRKDGKFTFAREGWLADYDDPINMLEMFRSDSGNNDPQFGKQ